jgi:hypothetical protein
MVKPFIRILGNRRGRRPSIINADIQYLVYGEDEKKTLRTCQAAWSSKHQDRGLKTAVSLYLAALVLSLYQSILTRIGLEDTRLDTEGTFFQCPHRIYMEGYPGARETPLQCFIVRRLITHRRCMLALTARLFL